MTKKQTFDTVMGLCEEYKAPEELVNELTKLLKPKSSGPVMDIDAVTKKDAGGNITHIKCSLSDVFLPATEQYFYRDKTGRSKLNGLKRNSRQADKIKKAFEKARHTSEKAIMNDVLSGNLTSETGKAKIGRLDKKTPDYQTVSEFVEVAD